jgi:hypothetical protein
MTRGEEWLQRWKKTFARIRRLAGEIDGFTGNRGERQCCNCA